MSEIHRITPPSTVILNERKYPVITNDPSFSDICECSAESVPGEHFQHSRWEQLHISYFEVWAQQRI